MDNTVDFSLRNDTLQFVCFPVQAMSSMNKALSPEKMMQDMKRFQMESDKMEMKEELSMYHVTLCVCRAFTLSVGQAK